MNDDISAAAQLATAERTAAAVRRRSRWAIWTYIATGTLSYVVAVSITAPLNRPAFWIADAALIVCGLVTGAVIRRRPVVPRGYGVRNAAVIGAWIGAWALLMIYGYPIFHHDPAFWIPAGAVPALVLYVGAFLEYREAQR